MGVSGLECWHSLLRYPDNTQELEALKLAKKYDLFVSGGSDHDGLCGGQYERYENLDDCRFYHTECSLGTREEFFREIKNGKKGRAIKDTTISGVAFEMLKTVSMVSSDFEWVTSGTCGKKQPMQVSMGGPYMKCRVSIGGR